MDHPEHHHTVQAVLHRSIGEILLHRTDGDLPLVNTNDTDHPTDELGVQGVHQSGSKKIRYREEEALPLAPLLAMAKFSNAPAKIKSKMARKAVKVSTL